MKPASSRSQSEYSSDWAPMLAKCQLVWLVWSLMAKSTLLRSCGASQFHWPHFYWAGLALQLVCQNFYLKNFQFLVEKFSIYLNWCFFVMGLLWYLLSVSLSFSSWNKVTLHKLTFITLWANSADYKLMIYFLFFPENRIWLSNQFFSFGVHLHEVSNPVAILESAEGREWP